MTPEGLMRIQKTDKLTTAEKAYIFNVQCAVSVSFLTALFEAIARADKFNRAKISVVFPLEVQAYLAWTQGDLHERASEIAGEPCS